MSELMIDKSKKVEWLQRNGPENALELLGIQVEELHEKAVQNRMLSKEINSMENKSIDPLAGLTENPVVQVEDTVDDLSALVQEDVVQDQVETPVVKAVAETPVVENVEEVQDTNRELIDTLIVEIVNPMIEELKEVRKEIEAVRKEKAEEIAARVALQKQVDTLQKELQVQGLQIKEETLPQASTAALLKNYIKEQLSNGTVDNATFGSAVPVNDPILAKKPVENKSKSANSGTFGGFLDGN